MTPLSASMSRTNSLRLSQLDHAITCRPIIRTCTGFFDEWEASVNVHVAVGQSRLDQNFAFSTDPAGARQTESCSPVRHY